MSLHIVILAAGEGRRMLSRLPKALVELGGQPMLAHLLATARALAPQRLSVVTGHGVHEVRQAFKDAGDIVWVLQESPRGTGHAVLLALQALSLSRAAPQTSASHAPLAGRLLVLYADGPLVSLDALRALIDRDEPLAVLGANIETPTGFGRLIRDEQGALASIVEEQHTSEVEKRLTEVNTGIMLGDAALIHDLLASMPAPGGEREQYLTDIIALARRRGLTVGCVMATPEDAALGANTLEEVVRLERIYQARMASALMRQGVRLADPAAVQVRAQVRAGMDCFVDAGVVLEGEVELGEGVSVGPGVVIKDAHLGDGTRIEANTVIEGVITGPGCRLGPFARLRPGTRLGRNVHIGAFVEVKNATIGAHSKANHQAYLGDVEIGERCNIGAGVITCNYDGAEKHRTRIGDRVFVGSNVTLVAPLEVASDAYVAAGSTLSRDVGESALAVSRARQKNIDGWTPPGKRVKGA